MTAPRISVVVPFYNNEDLLGECLQSIAAQTITDLEVIMVDDGSADGSGAVAQAQVDTDPRFQLVRIPNGGPGHARNTGVKRARGEYLAFVDADDTLPSHAYELLLHALESSGSDFVSGGAEILGPHGPAPSALHALAIKGRKTRTHISRTPELFYDVTTWNKMFRKSFWDAHNLSFPEGMVYEDIQLITRAHVLARAVDVIPDSVYYWRARGKGELSITQSRIQMANLRDRVAALQAIDSFLAENASRKLRREHQRKALVNDIWLYVRDLARTTPEYRSEFAKLGSSYLRQVDPRVLTRLPAPHKLAYHLLATGRIDQLVEFAVWLGQQPIKTIPVIRKFGKLRADLPFRQDRALKVPGKIYKPYWRELDPFVRVDGVSWQQGRLVITGCAFVPSIDITKRRHTSKIVILRPYGGGRLRPPIVLPARSLRHAEATFWSAQDRYSYDWGGFRCEISPRWFRFAGRWLVGDWDCFLLVRGRGVWRPTRLHSPTLGPAECPEYHEVAPGVRLGARWIRRQLHIQVVSTAVVLRSCVRVGSKLVIEADSDLPGADVSPELVLAWSKGIASQVFPATPKRLDSGAFRIRAEVPIDALGASALWAAAAQAAGAGDSGVVWDLYVKAEGQKRTRVAFLAGQAEYRYADGAEETAVEQTRYGYAVIVRRGLRPIIEEHSWSSDGVLTLVGGCLADPAADYEIVLRRRGSTAQHVVSMERDGDRFTARLEVTRMASFGQQVPLWDGVWHILVRQAGLAADSGLVVPLYDHARLSQVGDKKLVFGSKRYRFAMADFDAPIISVGPALRLAEHGRLQRRMLGTMYYPVQLKRTMRDAVMLISWKGAQCADNPRAIAEELRRRGDDREHIWAVKDWSVPVPDGARGVLTGTEEYFEELARSRYLIANDDMPAAYHKRDGQVYVQTWHGTPLKRIGFDIENPQFLSGVGYLGQLAQDVAKWDLLLSPNPFSTPIMRRAFRYDGDICESGYPRNDVLHGPDTDLLAARVRQRIGLPASKRVVLYAPTWRDNQYYASGRYRFDFRLDLELARQQLGDDHVFLIRGHNQMSDDVPIGTPGFAINVTQYPDIAELFLVSDILITDYSSAMFDFAPTGRPMLFYTYDLAQYRDNLRGFYLDFEAEAPGPLLSTSDEVVAAIADIDQVSARYRAPYEAFRARYCPLDDGKAATRACDRIFDS